ncbi:MAG: PIN domain-containing protein [Elainellaceae cyanobacterium]
MVLPAAPIILVLDVSTLSSTSTREWLGFSRAGACYVPQVVYEEMRFLYDRYPDPDLERVARDFSRFYPTSGWQITDVMGHHMILKSATGYALTKRLRVSLAVARCSYGLSEKNPKSLVVTVASDRAILQRVYDIQVPNLTGIQGAALLQWSRSGQRPVAITQKLQEMKSCGILEGMTTNLNYAHRPASTHPVPTASQRVAVTSIPRQSGSRSRSSSARQMTHGWQKSTGQRARRKFFDFDLPDWFPQFVSMFLSLVALSCAGGVIWIIFFTNILDRFVPADEPLGQRSVDVQAQANGMGNEF